MAGVPKGSDSNAYFVKRVTIHVGDRVRWKINGFHTVTVPPEGDDPPPFIGQDASGTKISGVNDAAGNPFWFNGQTRITLTDEGSLSQGGSRYNGNKLASSGAPLQAGPPRPYTLRFTRKGTYSYYCTIHPGMKGTVKVVSRGKRIPTNPGEHPGGQEGVRQGRQAAQARTTSSQGRAGQRGRGGSRHAHDHVLPLLPRDEERSPSARR